MHFEGIPMTGPMVIKRTESFYDEMEITDVCVLGGRTAEF
jgi:hypothetical protein